jgi:predicted RNA-binding Zn-ribbon protein involved in translation (DUF1610 family)
MTTMCAHLITHGQAVGENIIFTCKDCGTVVKTIHQTDTVGGVQKAHLAPWSGMSAGPKLLPKFLPSMPLTSSLKGYYRRHKGKATKDEYALDSGKPLWKWCRWDNVPMLTEAAAKQVKDWDELSMLAEYAVVRCVSCGVYHNQADWHGTHCPACGENKAAMKTNLSGKPYLVPTMKNGDVRRLPKVNSPLWTTQWSVQGTAKLPYVVSRKNVMASVASGSTADQGWACSCPNFTQHSPRTECKHILKVMLTEGVKPSSPPVASLPEDQQAAFNKFLREQAARGTPALPAGKARPLITQGRRFR